LRRASVNQIEIAYDDFGGVADEGRPLVLVHGLTGHRADWDARQAELSSLGRCIAPDLRGHGDSTNTGDAGSYRFAQLVDDLGALLDHLAIDRCDLLGHSVGGMVALRFALAQPERVASLVAMDTAPFAPVGYSRKLFEAGGAYAREHGMAALQQRAEEVAKSGRRPASASDRHIDRWADRYWPHHRRRFNAMDPLAYQELGYEMVGQQGVADRLAEVRCATLVMVGADDSDFLPGADALESGISGAERVTIPQAGHHPHQENPDVWLQALRDHLARVRA
jgi:pimeloyl-ACP methyl ester carboxylesterase